MTQEDFFRIFGTGRQEMDRIISAGLSGGGDWCDLYFEHTIYNDLLLRDGEVNTGGYHEDFGVGIRVLDGEKTGYAYSESTEPGDMIAAARAASSISIRKGQAGTDAVKRRQGSGEVPDMKTAGEFKNLYPIRETWENADHSRFLPVLQRIDRSVRQKDSRVVKVIIRLSDYQSYIMMYNSLGELATDSRPMCSITVTAVFSQNGKTENSTSSWSHRCGADMISEALADRLAEETIKGIDARFDARRPKGGEMSVVMAAGASGILLHEAMGHAFEADFNRKGQSVFSGKIGSKICGSGISIVDDGTIPGNRGAGKYDDEGVPGQKTYMVRDGILESYLHDRISASYYGVRPTGNGRRESFRFNPIPRMRATYMEAGDARPQDIIASVRHGIYVDEFSNGQVRIGEGDFTFYVRSGFLIEDGKLTAPVKDINVIGNGPEALTRITAVGNDLKIDEGTWTCGKEQNVPVSIGIPTVLISSLVVGGE